MGLGKPQGSHEEEADLGGRLLTSLTHYVRAPKAPQGGKEAVHLVSTHCMPSAMPGTLRGWPHLVLSEGPLLPARSSVESPLPEKPLEGLVRDGGCPATPLEPVHCRERRGRPWRLLASWGRKGPQASWAHCLKSSPASRLPPILTTKLSSENTFLPISQSRQAEAGPQKERICGEVGQGGTERRQANDTSLAMNIR